jgi:hypothetical protein
MDSLSEVDASASDTSASFSSSISSASILSHLRAAPRSELGKVKVYPPVGKKSHKRARTAGDPKSV